MGIIQTMLARKYQLEDEQKRSKGVNALIGEKGWEQSGAMPQLANGLLEQRQTIGGNGLLGGAGMFDKGNRGNFATGLMQLPGMENIGANLMSALNKEGVQQDQFQQKLDLSKLMAKNKASQWTPKDILSATTAQQTQFNKENLGYRNTLVEFNNVGNMVRKAGGFANLTPTDTYAAITSFAKTLKPNEAVMADDVANVLNLAGFNNPLELAKNLKDGKQLTEQQASDMYTIMEQRAQEAAQRGNELRAITGNRLQGTPIQPGNVMQEQVGFNPYQGNPGAAESGQFRQPATNEEQDRFTRQTNRAPDPDGAVNMIPPGIPFQDPRWPGKWVTYDDAGGIVEYTQG